MFQKNKKMDLYGEEGSSPEATPDKDEVKVEHHRQKFEILARALQVSVAKRSTESRQVLNGESVFHTEDTSQVDLTTGLNTLFPKYSRWFRLGLLLLPTAKRFLRNNRAYFKINQTNHNSLIWVMRPSIKAYRDTKALES